MAKKNRSQTPPTVLDYSFDPPGSNTKSEFHSYNPIGTIHSIDKLCQHLKAALRAADHDRDPDPKTKGRPAAPKQQKFLFSESSRGFHLLTMMCQDCFEANLVPTAYQLVNIFYEAACVTQLVNALNLAGEEKKHASTEIFLQTRQHKGHLTFDLASICRKLGWTWHHRYYLALTLAEDALTHFFLVPNGAAFCKLLLSNKHAFRQFDAASEQKERHNDKRKLDMSYLKFLVTPKAEEHWKEPDQPDPEEEAVESLEKRIARFWCLTGLCQRLRADFNVTLPDVMAMVIQMVERIFTKAPVRRTVDKTAQAISPPLVGEYHGEDKVSFAQNAHFKHPKWGAAWLGFPEWVANQAGIFEFLPSPVAPEEAYFAPFNAAYYGYVSHSIMQLESLQNGSTQRWPREHKGLIFEELSAYLCTAIPGVRVVRNSRSGAGELDLIGYVSSSCSLLHSITGNHFIGECKWQSPSIPVDVVDALTARAKRMRTDSVVVFSRNGISGADLGNNAERIIHAEAMHGVSFAPIHAISELEVENAGKQFAECIDNIRKDSGKHDPVSGVRGMVRLSFPRLLRSSFDRYRFGFYGSDKGNN